MVARNHIAVRGDRPADGISQCAIVDEYARLSVAQGYGAVLVCADIVVGDDVLIRARILNVHAILGVARDDVAIAGNADVIELGAVLDPDAVALIGDCPRAGGIRANVVALDDVAGGAAQEIDAAPLVAGDDVARAGYVSTDGVVATLRDRNAVTLVGQGNLAGAVRPDHVA